MPVNGVNEVGKGYNLKNVASSSDKNVKAASDDSSVLPAEAIMSVVDMVTESVQEVYDHLDELTETEETKFVKADERVVASEYDTVNAALAWAIKTVDDQSVGYSNDTRWGDPNYDCSSFVISAFEAAGYPIRENGAYNTNTMREAFLATGDFEWIPGPIDMSTLQPGDILLNEASHTEIYAGNGNTLGAHENFDGSDGDSSGTEVDIEPYSGFTIDGVLRYKGS